MTTAAAPPRVLADRLPRSLLSDVTGSSFAVALWQGAGVFLLGDALKALLAAGLLPGAWWLASR